MTTGFTSSLDSDETAISTIRRGLREAPVLRTGLWFTFLLAAVGSGGRVVVPILIQQAIDRGIVGAEGEDSGRRRTRAPGSPRSASSQCSSPASRSARRRSGSACAANERCTTCASG